MKFAKSQARMRCRGGSWRFGLFTGFFVLLMIAVANCGGVEPNAAVKTAVSASAPSGGVAPAQGMVIGDATWVLESLDGHPVVEESFVTLKIEDDRFFGFDGCNSYGGRSKNGALIKDADGVFSVPPLWSTAMDCPEPLGVMDQADAYMSVLIRARRYRMSGERLEILDSDGAARLVFARQMPLDGRPIDLSGTAWRLMMGGSAPGDDRAATLVFLDDRLVSGNTACRAYLATYSKSEASLRFPSKSMLNGTQSCSDDARRLESEFGDFLTWAREYAVSEDEGSSRLTIWSVRGKTLTFKPLSPSVGDVADSDWALVAFGNLPKSESGLTLAQTTSVVEGTDVTLSFDDHGVSGFSGCNSYAGPAVVGDGSVTIDGQSFFSTAKSCKDLDRVMEQEEPYLDLLPRMTRYGAYGDSLFMRTDDDGFLLFRY